MRASFGTFAAKSTKKKEIKILKQFQDDSEKKKSFEERKSLAMTYCPFCNKQKVS